MQIGGRGDAMVDVLDQLTQRLQIGIQVRPLLAEAVGHELASRIMLPKPRLWVGRTHKLKVGRCFSSASSLAMRTIMVYEPGGT